MTRTWENYDRQVRVLQAYQYRNHRGCRYSGRTGPTCGLKRRFAAAPPADGAKKAPDIPAKSSGNGVQGWILISIKSMNKSKLAVSLLNPLLVGVVVCFQ